MYEKDEEELVADLRQIGFQISSVWDFVNSNNYYTNAKSVLIKHLALPHHPKTHEGIARSLAIPAFSEDESLWKLLTDLYLNTPPNAEIQIPEERGLQGGLAVAISALATKDRVDVLRRLCEETPAGDGNIFFKEKIEKLER